MAVGARILLCLTALLARAFCPEDIIPVSVWILMLLDIILFTLSAAAAKPGRPGRVAASKSLAACAEGLGLALLATVPGAGSPWRGAVLAACASLMVLLGVLPLARSERRTGAQGPALPSVSRGLSAAAASSFLGASVPEAAALAAAGAVAWAASALGSSEAGRTSGAALSRPRAGGSPGRRDRNAQASGSGKNGAGRPFLRLRPRGSDARLQEQLLSTLSHEIRTPLTIMQTAGNILLEETPGSLNERQKRFLESIRINIQRLISFSETVLTAIKLDRNLAPDRSKAVDLRIIIRQVADTLGPLLSQRSQELRCVFPALPSRPMADESWIRQALVNLVHNASKHTPQGGLVMISLTQDEHQVVVTVTDNGRGLAGPGREALFGEFYQEKPNSLSGLDGFGLGLTIVRSMIEAHGGTVRIGSSPDHGTMVSFTLPVEACP